MTTDPQTRPPDPPPSSGVLRFALTAGAWCIGLFGLMRLGWVERQILLPFAQLQERVADQLTGVQTDAVYVDASCSGGDAMALCLGAVLAFPATWSARLRGAGVGLLVIAAFNIVRIGNLSLLGDNLPLLDLLHVYIWPAILIVVAVAYVYAWMRRRVRRLMREHDLQAPQRAGHAHGPKAHDGTITTEAPDVMWGTDMTATVTVAEGPAFVFVAVDHCTAECIGLHAAKRGTRFEALEPIRQGIRERFGGIGDGVARGLRLRHDHGSNYLADDFQQEVAFFGIQSSPSFVREPEGNGVAERFIRTLKENLLWVRSFATIEELRLALLAFKRTYNEQWILEQYDYRSPAQVRRDLVGLDAAA